MKCEKAKGISEEEFLSPNNAMWRESVKESDSEKEEERERGQYFGSEEYEKGI